MGVSSGYEVIRGGQGYSTKNPQKGDIVLKKLTGGKTSYSARNIKKVTQPVYPKVSISGNTVFINGQGYSVAQNLQAEFIRQQTGGMGSSAQQAIQRAQQQAEAIRQAEIKQQQEAQRQAQQKKQVVQTKVSAIKDRGAVQRTYTSTDQKTGVTSDVTEYRKGAQIIREFKERKTGRTRYEEFGTGKAGGGRRFLGSTTFQETPTTTKEETKVLAQGNILIPFSLPSGTMPKFDNYIINPEISKITEVKDYKTTLPPIQTQPYIEKRVVDTFKDQETGKKIPVSDIFYIDPTGIGKPKERKATAEEIKYYESQQIGVVAVPLTKIEKAVSRVGLYSDYKSFKEATLGRWSEFKDIPLYNVEETQKLFGESLPGRITGGVVTGLVPETKGEGAILGAILGISAGISYVYGALTTGTTALTTRLFGTTAGKVAGTGIKLTGTGAGLYFGGTYAYSVGQQVYYAPTVEEKTRLITSSVRNVGISVVGWKVGAKGWARTEGLINTRGRTFIDIPQGEYPTAPPSQQLEMFKKNLYPALGDKPGAFHTTGEIFWKGGQITPLSGTSELPGIYGSTKISTPFSRITGSGSTTKFSFTNWFKDIFSVKEPGVAYLQPEGFRYSPAKPGQWFKPAKFGYADVPGIKSEIEAIFRPEAGGYALKSQGFYTTIKGVRVPIDSFVYNPKIISGEVTGVKLIGGQSSYSGYPSYSFSPTLGVTGYSLGSTSTSATQQSVIPITPSYSSVYSSIPSYTATSSIIKSSVRSVSPSRTTSLVSSVSPSMSKAYSSTVSKPSVSKSVSKISSVVPSYASSMRSIYRPPYVPTKTTKPFIFKLPKAPSVKQPRGRFPVYVRRFGQWKSIGFGKTEKQALLIGKEYSQKTLGRSFYVPGVKPTKLLPGFRTKKEKDKLIYIQKTKYPGGSTLGSLGEKKEIKFFRGLKSPTTKKKKKRGFKTKTKRRL